VARFFMDHGVHTYNLCSAKIVITNLRHWPWSVNMHLPVAWFSDRKLNYSIAVDCTTCCVCWNLIKCCSTVW